MSSRPRRPRSWAQLGVLQRQLKNKENHMPREVWFRGDGMEHAQPWYCVSRQSIVTGVLLSIILSLGLGIGIVYLYSGLYRDVVNGRVIKTTKDPDYVSGEGVVRLLTFLSDSDTLATIIVIVLIYYFIYYMSRRNK